MSNINNITNIGGSNGASIGELSPYSNEMFNDQWNLYQKVLSNNYMEHREIYGVLHEFLVSYFQKPFKMLELGCGDASFSVQALLNTTITCYQGIDLSEVALEIALNNMALINCETSFTQGDFSELVPELVKSQPHDFDAILASFTLHHLTLEQKDCIIGQLSRLVKAGGVFILIDVVRREAEDRDTYLKRYLDNLRQNWSALTSQEIAMVEDHIYSSDFQETQKILYELGRKHNFIHFDCLYHDLLDTSQVLCFYR
ncbi:MAG: class I SAM-dependent methyltransferase [Heteroscytonema crispum UTEX LB 1556]